MTIEVDLQNVIEKDKLNHVLPNKQQFEVWLNASIATLRHLETENAPFDSSVNTQQIQQQAFELTLRIVDETESQQLNFDYRDKNKPTNVLSFPFEAPEHIDMPYLGGLVVCAAVVELEAQTQKKNINDHWAHLCIHGLLHLLGYDHINDEEAQEMEGTETTILAKLGIDDPYQDH